MPVDFGPMNSAVLDTFEHLNVTIAGIGTVQAIYDSRHYTVDEGEVGGSDLITSITVADAHAAAVVVEDTEITVGSKVYVASDKRPLGEGMTTIELWKKL